MCTKTVRGETYSIGQEVRYHSYAWGWRFGHLQAFSQSEGLTYGTVRWIPHKGDGADWPGESTLPLFLMEPCS